MPGWFEESPPPSGFTGSAPPRPMRPPDDEVAALARLAEAEVLERREHGDRERVVDHAQIDVVARDARHAEGLLAGLLRGDRQQVGRADLLVADRLAAAEQEHRRAWRRSRARSALVTTSAPPPSLMMQQSSRCSGREIIRLASTSSTVIGLRILAFGFSPA